MGELSEDMKVGLDFSKYQDYPEIELLNLGKTIGAYLDEEYTG